MTSIGNTKCFLYITIFLFFLTVSSSVDAQVYSNKLAGKKNEDIRDSLKNAEYPYSLPIWGKKVAAKGYNLPYSAGLGINYVWQKSDIVIDNLSVGFNNGPMHNVDEIVRINHASTEASIINFRPDIWVLPFLNVYGILAVSKPSTAIDFGLWVPDSSNTWHEIGKYSTKANFNGTSVGFGLTPTIGVAGGWMALDMNFTWTDVDALEKPAFSYIFGPRLGKTFKFKKPEQNIAFWVGGFRVKFGSSTKGSISLSEVIPPDNNAQAKIDAGQEKVAESQMQVDTWWNNLSESEQNNPVNKAKYKTANSALGKAGDILNAADGALDNISNSSVQYSLNKRVKDMWNFIVGTQFQLNKRWMLRAEYGFLGSRQQLITGLQFRFGL